LRPHVQALGRGEIPELKIEKSEEERAAYIESQAKSAMERVGVEARTTLADEGGKRVGRDEVMALEGIVGALGGKSTGRGNDDDEDRMEE